MKFAHDPLDGVLAGLKSIWGRVFFFFVAEFVVWFLLSLTVAIAGEYGDGGYYPEFIFAVPMFIVLSILDVSAFGLILTIVTVAVLIAYMLKEDYVVENWFALCILAVIRVMSIGGIHLHLVLAIVILVLLYLPVKFSPYLLERALALLYRTRILVRKEVAAASEPDEEPPPEIQSPPPAASPDPPAPPEPPL